MVLFSRRMNYFLNNSSKSRKVIEKREQIQPSFQDQSLVYVMRDICYTLFRQTSPEKLSDAEQERLVYELRRRFGYRIVKAQWSGKGTGQYDISIRVTGRDDIAIVNNMTSIIAKEENILLRSINIDSDDGLFRGVLTITASDTTRLNSLIKKLKGVKGVHTITRI